MALTPKLKKIIIFGGLALLVIIYFLSGNGEEVVFVTETAEEGEIEQVVSVNGTVESDAIINLRFQQSGKIESLPFFDGAAVEKGTVLGELENDSLEIEVSRANAAVDIAQAELNLRNAGPTSPEVRISLAAITEAEINLANAIEKLADTRLANNENIRTAELELENAQIAVANAEKKLGNVSASGETDTERSTKLLSDAYEDTRINLLQVQNNTQTSLLSIDNFLGVDNDSSNNNFEDFFPSSISLSVIIAESDYNKLKSDLATFEDSYDNLMDITDDLEEPEKADAYQNLLEEAVDVLEFTEDLLDRINDFIDAIFDDETADTIADNELEILQSEVDTELAAITSDLLTVINLLQTISDAQLDITSTGISTTTEFDDAEASLSDAQNNLKIAESNLEKVKVESIISENADQREVDVSAIRLEQAEAEHEDLIAKPRFVDIAALQASVRQEAARRDKALNDLEDTQILAPVGGIVTQIEAEVGENIGSNDEVVTMITDELQIKANIAETDIIKIATGDPVEITLDAFPLQTIFDGTIVSVNPAETVIQGVIYYEAVIVFDQEYDGIKSGMTANLDILTDSADDAVVISSQAIQYDNDQTFVYVLKGGEKVRKNISIGLEGDATVEVVDGLSAGEEVVLYEE